MKSEVVAAADYEGMLEEENFQEEEYGEQYLEGSQGYTPGGHQEESKGDLSLILILISRGLTFLSHEFS